MKSLVILPTYKEKESLPVVLIKVLAQENIDILVIDDNSPDGTATIAEHWVAQDKRVHLIKRPGKMGLGTAYITGFKWGLERNYDCMLEMDSDLSHNPLDLPKFLEEISAGADLVIGSRYMHGRISVVGWDFKRLLLSKMGNFYAARLLGMRVTDLTSGFRAYSRKGLEALELGKVNSEGYAFQIEMAYLIWKKGFRLKEIPIVFTERIRGISKMSKEIIREAVWLPWRLRLQELRACLRKLFSSPKKNLKEEA